MLWYWIDIKFISIYFLPLPSLLHVLSGDSQKEEKEILCAGVT